MRYVVLITLLWFITTSIAWSHYEDPSGCDAMVTHLPNENWVTLYEGISEDGRDYVFRYRHEVIIIEAHHILLPEAQWTSASTPAYMPAILSLWLDYNGDGVYGEWYLFPRGQGECTDALHFIWDGDKQVYRLYATGKERT